MRNMTITGNSPPGYRKDSIEMRFIDRSRSPNYDDEQGIRERIELLKKAGTAIPCPWCHGRYDSLDSLRFAVHIRSKYVDPSCRMICETCESWIEGNGAYYIVPHMASMGNEILLFSEGMEGELRLDLDLPLDGKLRRYDPVRRGDTT